MKKSIVASSIILFLIAGGSANAESSFTDLKSDHWAYKSVTGLATKNVISGYDDGSYKPNNTITRAELAAILTRVSGQEIKETTKSSFFDVKPSDWYSPYAEGMSKYLGCFKNKETGSVGFFPDRAATREEIASAIVLLKEYKASNQNIIEKYTDARDISPTRLEHLAAAAEHGIISGYDDKTIRPRSSVTRAEAAVIIWRAFGKSDAPNDKSISVNGIKIGDSKSQLMQMLGKPLSTREVKYGAVGYEYKDTELFITNDQVSSISIYGGSSKLSDGLGLGSTLKEVIELYGEENLRQQKEIKDSVYVFINDHVAVSFGFDNNAQAITDGRLRDTDTITYILIADLNESIKASGLYEDIEHFKADSTQLDYVRTQ